MTYLQIGGVGHARPFGLPVMQLYCGPQSKADSTQGTDPGGLPCWQVPADHWTGMGEVHPTATPTPQTLQVLPPAWQWACGIGPLMTGHAGGWACRRPDRASAATATVRSAKAYAFDDYRFLSERFGFMDILSVWLKLRTIAH